MRLYKQWISSCVAAAVFASAGWAQYDEERGSDSAQQRQQQQDSESLRSTGSDDDRQRGEDQQRDSERQRNDRQRSERQAEGDQQRQDRRSRRDEPRLRVEPTGWVRMAVDYDNDGTFDAIETIYTYDLERARKSSRDRANRDAQAQRSGSQGDRTASRSQRDSDTWQRDQRTSANSRSEHRVSGQLLQLREQKLAGVDEPFIVARIRDKQNFPAKALLGTRSQLKPLNLEEGDQITVEGVRGRVNDRSMLIAKKILSGDEQITIDTPSSRGAKRVRGEVMNTRNVRFRGRDQQFVVAQVQFQNGKRATVNLGPQSKVNQLDLEQGDEVRMIVRPARVNGRAAMVADAISANGTRVEVTRPEETANARRSQVRAQTERRRSGEQGEQRDPRQSREQDEPRQQRERDEQSDERANASDRPALGIAVAQSAEGGIEILAIHPASPAAEQDLQEGDQILSINGESVENASALIEAVGEMQPDDEVKLRIRRDDQEQTVSVRLIRRSQLTSN